MKTEQIKLRASDTKNIEFTNDPDLILIFGSSEHMKDKSTLQTLRKNYPNAIISGCSTAGEILGVNVTEDTLVATAINFEETKVKESSISLNDYSNSIEAGKGLVEKIDKKDLKHVLIFSDGLHVNGADLVKGMAEVLPKEVSLTGGLAGDGADFKKTYVINNNGEAGEKIISAVGLYGNSLRVGYGSMGGWDSFGMERLVTKSKGNVLYELDGEPALKLYKSFLGDKAKELPSSALLFPLSLRVNPDDKPVVRTILAVNEEEQSMTFAGDINQGGYVRLMKANIDRLINGAGKSAEVTLDSLEKGKSELAILISCVGRKLVLKQLVEEEVEEVGMVLGDQTALTGFYSYGEIAPFGKFSACELHNQTMTITTFSES